MRRRRQERPDPGPDELGPQARTLVDMHLLLVPSTIDVVEVDELLRARIPTADLAGTGEVRIGRHGRIVGPYELSMEDAVDAAVPMPWTICYALQVPAEREDPPLPGADDRDGFASAFPDGLPWRDEGRALHLLAALARRLGGAVRTAGTLQLIQPDPDRAVDYVVHAPYWLDPDVLLSVLLRDMPGAQLAVQGQAWHGPGDEVYSGEAYAASAHDHPNPLTAEQVEALHVAADEADLSRLGGTASLDGYAVTGPLGADGMIEVSVHIGDADEPAVAGQPWADRPFVTYEVRWLCPQERERERRAPTQVYLASRDRVAPVVRAVTRSVVEATSGLATDEDGFWLDRYAM
jgi:hypothetical protein